MNIDKFGRGTSSSSSSSRSHDSMLLLRSQHLQQGLPKTSDGNYDVGNLKLRNVGAPLDPLDATTKQYVDKLVEDRVSQLATKVQNNEGTVEKLTSTLEELLATKAQNNNNNNEGTVKKLTSSIGELRFSITDLRDHIANIERSIIGVTAPERNEEMMSLINQAAKKALEDMDLTTKMDDDSHPI